MEEASSSDSVAAAWSREQEKAFENALATHGENWEELAAAVEGKSLEDIKKHYELLVEDVDGIEAGRVQLPPYMAGQEGGAGGEGGSKKDRESAGGGKGSRSEQERRKGIAWTEDEHRLFLLGLDKYGKGDWRSISRNFVISRTPTQVASHAQKYFIRLNSMNKERRRSSIHDITSINNSNTITSEPTSSSQPITGTGQGIGLGSSSSMPPGGAKPGSIVVGTSMAVSMPVPINYGTATIGQPVAPAVGTPVTVPQHLPYGSVVPGAPVAYPMPPNISHPHHSHR